MANCNMLTTQPNGESQTATCLPKIAKGKHIAVSDLPFWRYRAGETRPKLQHAYLFGINPPKTLGFLVFFWCDIKLQDISDHLHLNLGLSTHKNHAIY